MLKKNAFRFSDLLFDLTHFSSITPGNIYLMMMLMCC